MAPLIIAPNGTTYAINARLKLNAHNAHDSVRKDAAHARLSQLLL